MSEKMKDYDQRISTIVGEADDFWFRNAVRDRDLVDEEGALAPGGCHLHRVAEEKVEVRAVRTWRLEYVGDGRPEALERRRKEDER